MTGVVMLDMPTVPCSDHHHCSSTLQAAVGNFAEVALLAVDMQALVLLLLLLLAD